MKSGKSILVGLFVFWAAGIAASNSEAAGKVGKMRSSEGWREARGPTKNLARAESAPIKNFARVERNFYRGGELNRDRQFDFLSSQGVKTIISLVEPDEMSPSRERHAARKHGMEYYNFPMNNVDGPSDSQVRQILSLIQKNLEGGVFIHCAQGLDRTGALVALFQIECRGVPAEKAYDAMMDFGADPRTASVHYVEDRYGLHVGHHSRHNSSHH